MKKKILFISILTTLNTSASTIEIGNWIIDEEKSIMSNVSTEDSNSFIIIDESSVSFHKVSNIFCEPNKGVSYVLLNNRPILTDSESVYFDKFCQLQETIKTKQGFEYFENELYYNNYKVEIDGSIFDLKGYDESIEHLKQQELMK